ncbi:MAG: sialidase family protein [Bryobacterales bacterium]|nr:sialidase family protein [Bryobacterales bacterium]
MGLSRPTFSIGLLTGLAAAQDRSIDQRPVFSAGEDGYHTLRIPALLPTGNGALLAFAEGRRVGRGDSGAIDLVLKRSTDSGTS